MHIDNAYILWEDVRNAIQTRRKTAVFFLRFSLKLSLCPVLITRHDDVLLKLFYVYYRNKVAHSSLVVLYLIQFCLGTLCLISNFVEK